MVPFNRSVAAFAHRAHCTREAGSTYSSPLLKTQTPPPENQRNATVPTALIIDDEPGVREAIGRTLAKAGFVVKFAPDGIAGLEAYRDVPVDLVITDIIMPRANGVETIKALRAEFPSARILAISGGGHFGPAGYEPGAITTAAYLAAAAKAGADAMLTKPFGREELLGEIHRMFSTQ